MVPWKCSILSRLHRVRHQPRWVRPSVVADGLGLGRRSARLGGIAPLAQVAEQRPVEAAHDQPWCHGGALSFGAVQVSSAPLAQWQSTSMVRKGSRVQIPEGALAIGVDRLAILSPLPAHGGGGRRGGQRAQPRTAAA